MSFSKDEIQFFNAYWVSQEDRLRGNARLIDIKEGHIMPYITHELQAAFTTPSGDLSPSYKEALDCIIPINILEHTIDKKSKIYQKGVRRTVGADVGSEEDTELLEFYESKFKANRQMNIVNEYYNLFGYAAVEPVVYNNRYVLRPLPNDKFLPVSRDPIDKTTPTEFLVLHGHKMGKDGKQQRLLRVYSQDRFAIINEDDEVDNDEMKKFNSQGKNPFDHIGIYYFNKKAGSQLMPKVRDDVYQMAVKVPILLTHCMYGLKFQSFSVFYTIDVKDAARAISPNVMWSFQTDKNRDTKPQVGVLTPSTDSDKNVRFLAQVLTLWFETNNIKPGNMEGLNAGNVLSGISKILDEMDTSDDRTAQIEYFQPGEEEMWSHILKDQHPVWKMKNSEVPTQEFSREAEINVDFPEQLPLINRSQVVGNIKTEMELGLESRKGAMARLNPGMTESEIQEKLEEIDEEREQRAKKFGVPAKKPEDEETEETDIDPTQETE